MTPDRIAHTVDRPNRAPDQASEPAAPWNTSALAEALGARPEPTRDLLFGDGLAFRLGPVRAVELALYPDHRAVELSTPDAVVSLRRPSAAKPLDEHVLFQATSARQETTLVVGHDGAASLIVQPLDPSLPTITLPDAEPDGVSRP